MVQMPTDYFERPEVAAKYDRILYRAGAVLQSPELNEGQLMEQARLKGVADALFRDGSVISGAAINVDPYSGACTLEGGAIYLRGAVRGVPGATITVPIVGTCYVGVWYVATVVSELEDPALRDPAVGVDNTGEPGAARLLVTLTWGLSTDAVPDGQFYAVYTIVDGVVLPNAPPPDIDAISLALARYDRQSSGGHYVASGLTVTKLADLNTGEQVYSLAEGVARVNGREVTIAHAVRAVYPAVPDLRPVISEPQAAAGGTQRVLLNHAPIASLDQVLITVQRVVTLTHGAFSGVQDALPDTPVTSIIAVNVGGSWNAVTGTFNGGTNYAQGTDFRLTADKVDWSPTGAEPSPGTTYQCVYRYTAVATPTGVDDTGFTVSGAVPGTTMLVSYKWKRPRVDRLCLDPSGAIVWVQGVANDTEPSRPAVPPGLLPIASIRQTWTAARSVENDGVRTVPMGQLTSMQAEIQNLYALVSDQMLQTQAALSDPTTKWGVFTDPLLDDSRRDQGAAQTAAVFGGFLTLPMVNVTISSVALADDAMLTLDTAGTKAVISQELRTMCMKVNPYDAFEPLPASARLEPAVDFWTQTVTVWLSPITSRFAWTEMVWAPQESLGFATRRLNTSTRLLVDEQTETVSQNTRAAEFLRQINVAFTLTGFGPGEILDTVKFDGLSVAFTA